MARQSVLVLLDRLEELLSRKMRVAGRSWIDTEAAAELVNKIRATLPDEIREAEWLTSEKERLIVEAQEEAKRILRDAENYAAKLVQDSQVIRQAEHEAETIVAESRKQAAAAQEQARDYARRLFDQLADSLEKTMKIVHKVQEDLAEAED